MRNRENWSQDNHEAEEFEDAESGCGVVECVVRSRESRISGSVEYLYQRLESLKQEKDFKLKELERQRGLHLECVERRFEAEEIHLRHQLEVCFARS